MSHPHWQYFLTLDEDLQRLSRYIEIAPQNFATYSVELVRIILAAGSEIDVVAKQLYPSKPKDTMTQYTTDLPKLFPALPMMKVVVSSHGIDFEPWNAWRSAGVPAWWSDHNKVKHMRGANYPKANLENALHAVGGLLVLVAYLYKTDWDNEQISPEPKLLNLEEQYQMQNVIERRTPLP